MAHLGAGAALCIRDIAVGLLPVTIIGIIIGIAPAYTTWSLLVTHIAPCGSALAVMQHSGVPVTAAPMAAGANAERNCAPDTY